MVSSVYFILILTLSSLIVPPLEAARLPFEEDVTEDPLMTKAPSLQDIITHLYGKDLQELNRQVNQALATIDKNLSLVLSYVNSHLSDLKPKELHDLLMQLWKSCPTFTECHELKFPSIGSETTTIDPQPMDESQTVTDISL